MRQPIMPVKPNLQLNDYQGTAIDIAAISQESPVLIYFWGSWCHVCTITSPKVNQLHQDGYSVVSIAVKSGDDAQLGQYLQRHQYHFTTINDTDGQIFANWQGQVTPSFVILYQGKPVQRFTGIAPLWSLKLRMLWDRVQQ
ncbi:Membrane protein, suppressor for copper-sensitivity ScsD [Moraxella catarrhalis]|nr:Membrane protein, suppressor for copper-sensitivity ScsD [Moraxella catarrhalis]